MPAGLRRIRALDATSLRGITPAAEIGAVPTIEWVDPRDLWIEVSYQREILAGGRALIRKIVAEFSWAHFKPPMCVRVSDGLLCFDGQHTATGAATHPGVDKIPVMVVDAPAAERRARAFVNHNRVRIGLTQQAIFRAELVAKDPTAVVVDRACRAAGALVLDGPVNLARETPVGQTIAVGTLRSLAVRRGPEFLSRVLKVLVAAKRGPIKAAEIAGVAIILAAFGDRDGVDAALTRVIGQHSAARWAVLASIVTDAVGRPMASLLAEAWSKEALGERPPRGARGDTTGGLRSIASLPKPVPTAAPAAAPAPQKPAPLLQKAAPPKPVPKSADGIVIRNGVTIDTQTHEVTYQGHRARLEPRATVMVTALVRVMPAMLDNSNLIRKIFGVSPHDGGPALRQLVEATNGVLRTAHLEVRPVGRMGLMIAALG